jgi:hypothetical protein
MGVLRRRLVHLHMTVAANITVTGHHFIARRTTNPTVTRHRPVESDRHSKANDWTVILKGPPRRYYLRMLLPSPKYLLSIAHVNARRAPPAPGRHHRNLWTFYLALHLLVSSITSWKPVISRRLPEIASMNARALKHSRVKASRLDERVRVGAHRTALVRIRQIIMFSFVFCLEKLRTVHFINLRSVFSFIVSTWL